MELWGGPCAAISAFEVALSRAIFKAEAVAFDPAGFPFDSDACFFGGDLSSEATAAGAGRFADRPDGLLCSIAGTNLGHDKCCCQQHSVLLSVLLHMQFEHLSSISAVSEQYTQSVPIRELLTLR